MPKRFENERFLFAYMHHLLGSASSARLIRQLAGNMAEYGYIERCDDGSYTWSDFADWGWLVWQAQLQVGRAHAAKPRYEVRFPVRHKEKPHKGWLQTASLHPSLDAAFEEAQQLSRWHAYVWDRQAGCRVDRCA